MRHARRVYFWNPTRRDDPHWCRCAHADDVRHAVEFARRHGLEVAVRAGGHSPMGWGTSNGLVIDLAGMNRVTIDPATRTGRIEAGVLSGEVMRTGGTLWAGSGTRAVPGCRRCRDNARRRLGLAFRTAWSGLRQSAVRSYRYRGRPNAVCGCGDATQTCCGPFAAPAPILASRQALTVASIPLVPSRPATSTTRFARRGRFCDSSATSWPKRQIRFKPHST